jgi:DNA-binding IclR family transcriptional regulator
MKDEDALKLVSKQGIGNIKEFGPNAPKNLKAFLKVLQETRKIGFSLTQETYAVGLNALAVPVALNGHPPMGTISVAGPSARFTRSKMLKVVSYLLSCSAQLAVASGASPILARSLSKVPLDPIYAL